MPISFNDSHTSLLPLLHEAGRGQDEDETVQRMSGAHVLCMSLIV